MTISKIILFFFIVLCSYLYFTNPSKIVINEKGKIEDLLNKQRAILQGNKFWKLQLTKAKEGYNENLYPYESYSSKLKETKQKIYEAERNAEEIAKKLLNSEFQKAQVLKRKADSLEFEGKLRIIDENIEKKRLELLNKCKLLIPIIEAKLQKENQTHTPAFLLAGCILYVVLIIFSRYKKLRLKS